VYFEGPKSKAVIARCFIGDNTDAGIICSCGTFSIIQDNEIAKNGIGILAQFCDPMIVSNKINKNFLSGIVCRSNAEMGCAGTLKYNRIIENKYNGILCLGTGTNTLITNNLNITFNGRAGIKIT